MCDGEQSGVGRFTIDAAFACALRGCGAQAANGSDAL